MIKVLQGKIKSTVGLKFIYKDETLRPKIKQVTKRVTKLEDTKKRSDTKGCNKQFDVFTMDDKYIGTFTYQFEAIEYIKNALNKSIRPQLISKVLKGQRKSTAGLKFIYKDDIPSTSES